MSTNDSPSASTASGSGSNATDDVTALKAKISFLEAEVEAKANAIQAPEKTIVGITVTAYVESQPLIQHRLMVVCRFYMRRRGSSQMWHQENMASLLQQEDACLGMINKTTQGRRSQTIWTFCCSITTTSCDVTLIPRCDNRVRTRERRPRRQNISSANLTFIQSVFVIASIIIITSILMGVLRKKCRYTTICESRKIMTSCPNR